MSAIAKMNPIIELRHVYREFVAGNQTHVVLNDITLTIAQGEMVAIIGASGSGKSTLMNIAIGLLSYAAAISGLYSSAIT